MKQFKTLGTAAALVAAFALSACGRDDVPEPTTAPADTMNAPMTDPSLGATPGTATDPSLNATPGSTGMDSGTTGTTDPNAATVPGAATPGTPGSLDSTAPAGGAGSPDGSATPGAPSSSVSGKTRFA